MFGKKRIQGNRINCMVSRGQVTFRKQKHRHGNHPNPPSHRRGKKNDGQDWIKVEQLNTAY